MTLEADLTGNNSERIIEQIRKGTKPQGMCDLIFEYAKKALQLDDILSEITKEQCASNCPAGYTGCCVPGAYSCEVPEEMLGWQEIESFQNRGVHNSKNCCKYHSIKGCELILFKSPLCINSLCAKLRDYLAKEYGYPGEIFTSSMGKANNHESGLINEDEREKMFCFMDSAIFYGRKIVEMKKKNVGEIGK